MKLNKHLIGKIGLSGLLALSMNAHSAVIDFESGVAPTSITGAGTVHSTSTGYKSYGFGDYFLRSDGGSVALTLTGLATHDSIDLNFFLAIIDSWDGSFTSVAPDTFNVKVDGTSIFSETFDQFSSSDQSYSPAPGVQLTPTQGSNPNIYRSGWGDSAYNMGADSIFDNIAHSSSSLTIEWFASGSGWQGGADESFAIDNIEVVLNNSTANVPEPSTLALLGLGLLGLRQARKMK